MNTLTHKCPKCQAPLDIAHSPEENYTSPRTGKTLHRPAYSIATCRNRECTDFEFTYHLDTLKDQGKNNHFFNSQNG